MVRAWFMDDDEGDQRDLHMLDPPIYVELDELHKKTGVEYLQFDVDSLDSNPEYQKLKTSRGYTYEDVCEVSKDTLPNYEVKIKSFFTEHLHTDEEIRFIVAGSGYFDVRDCDDKWIRVLVEKNDMLIVPAGIYHRFTLDRNNYIKARRFFVGEPVWTPLNRPSDDHPVRVTYLESLKKLQCPATM